MDKSIRVELTNTFFDFSKQKQTNLYFI